MKENSPLHWSATRTVWDRKANRVELFGNAIIQQMGETLSADYASLDLTARTLDAKGHCIYKASEAVMHGDEMHFNLDTRTGTVVGGRVANDHFTLTGERINKLGELKYQTHHGTYSTCKDCPQSWTIQADDVELEIEEYAYLSNVTARVKEAPVFWLPYLVVPVKTKRQTGFLFPKFSFTNEGFNFVEPFFWAISRSADMTFSVGEYAARGLRAEWEGRYKLSGRDNGQANFHYQHDSIFEENTIAKNALNGRNDRVTPHRWSLDVKQAHDLPFGINEKLKILDASDNLYPSDFNDIQGNGDPALPSTLIFSHATPDVSSYVSAHRYRNILTPDPIGFDPKTVQVFPKAAVTTNNRFILDGPVAAGLTVGASNFTRTAEAFDRDQFQGAPATSGPFTPGTDPIRKATRVSYTPSAYTTIRPWDTVSIVPGLEYRGYYYSFHNEIPDLTRGYVLMRTDISTQLERVYERPDDPEYPRIKHLIRPIFTYSLIPYVAEDYRGKSNGISHPFLQQIEYANRNNFAGYNFDSYDIVPRDESRNYNQYYIPLGHSLSYGYTTQLVRRKGVTSSDTAAYQRIVEWRSGQTYNFRELKRARGDQQPFSKAFSSLGFEFDKWNGSLNYEYFPYLPIDEKNSRHAFSSNFSYIFEKGVRRTVMVYERSVSLAYVLRRTGSETSNLKGNVNYSISDYVLPSVFADYDFIRPQWLGAGTGLKFQSPSECWKLELAAERRTCDKPNGFCFLFSMDLSLNLTGSGYGGVDEFASRAGTAQ